MTHFIIMRTDGDGYASRGPIANPLPLEEAKAEIIALKRKYPAQDFVLFATVGEIEVETRVQLNVTAPDLSRPVLRLPKFATHKGIG